MNTLICFKTGDRVRLRKMNGEHPKFIGLIGVVVKADPARRDPESKRAKCHRGEVPVKVTFEREGRWRTIWVPHTKLAKTN